jgi:hypothetical protein
MVVQLSANGDALAGTILRAAAVRNGVAEVRTGGDLMADSAPEREERESRLKAWPLWRAFGLEASPSRSPPGDGIAALPAAVALLDAQDPFGAALADCLLGLGMQLLPGAPVAVLVGTGAAAARPRECFVAIGDAAALVLGEEGFEVRAITPENGRLIRCTPTAAALVADACTFIAARYLRWQVSLSRLPSGWEAWAQDEAAQPQLLVHPARQIACVLFRPDSLLSQPQARAMLAAALAQCSTSR